MQRIPSLVALVIALGLLSGCEFMQMEADKFGDKRGDVDVYGFRARNHPYGNNPCNFTHFPGGGYAGPTAIGTLSLEDIFPAGRYEYVPAPIPSPRFGK